MPVSEFSYSFGKEGINFTLRNMMSNESSTVTFNNSAAAVHVFIEHHTDGEKNDASPSIAPQQEPSMSIELVASFSDASTGEFLTKRQQDGTFSGKGHTIPKGKSK